MVRHGETELTRARRFCGHSDVQLNDAGIRQVERLRDRLETKKIDAIYSSDLQRTLLTAEIIASRHQLAIITCAELREMNYGSLECLTFEEICRSHPDVADCCVNWSPELKFPGGESFDDFKVRVRKSLSILEKHAPEETILIVSHGGPLRLLFCYLLEMEPWHWRQFQLDVASLSIIERYPDIAIMRLLNDTSHLSQVSH